MCSSAAQMFRSYGAWFVWVVVVYKHLVPLGPKTTATKKHSRLLLNTSHARITKQLCHRLLRSSHPL